MPITPHLLRSHADYVFAQLDDGGETIARDMREAADLLDLLPQDPDGHPLAPGVKVYVIDEDSRGPFEGHEIVKQIRKTPDGWHIACETCDTTPDCFQVEATEKARKV